MLVAAASALAAAPSGAAVAGGQPADPAAWPWTVALLDHAVPDPARAQFCAGVVVRGEWVMTAAHCVFDEAGRPLPPGAVQVGAGAGDLRAIGPAQRLPVAEVVVYPGYRPDRYARDLALLRLGAPSGLPAAEISPAAFDPRRVRAGWVAGWGLNEGGSTALLTGPVSVIGLRDCLRGLRALGSPWGTVCATMPASLEAATCAGDSGGPLADFGGPVTRIMGLTSYGPRLCAPGVPGVYTDTAAYRPWIMRVTAGGEALPGLPEIDSVYASDRGGSLLLRASWCQAGARGNRLEAQFVGRLAAPRGPGRGLRERFWTSVRGRAGSACQLATLRLPDRFRNGTYELRVKVIDRSSRLQSYGLPALFAVR